MVSRRPPIVIGIAGGIASGKSLVSEQLERHGATVISADQAAHEVLKHEEVKRQVRARWGGAVFGGDGEIRRAAVAEIVFAPPPDGPRERAFLEQLTHPHIGDAIRGQLDQVARQGQAPAVVLDVPLLFESGWNKICDEVVFVDAPASMRKQRAAARGWSAEEFARREGTQWPPETKRQQSDTVIDNSGTAAATAAQVARFWQALREREEAD